MSSKFRRMTLHSILERNNTDNLPAQWVEAILSIKDMNMWSSHEREMLRRYARYALSMSGDWDSIFPHHPRYSGSLHDCLLYYVGYWTGRMRELLRRWSTAEEYSPRAWGLLKSPLMTMQCFLISVKTTREGNQYVLHLG